MTYAKVWLSIRGSRYWWLALCTVILLLAAAFRLIALQDVPPGLAQDEVLDADIASFIRAGEHAFFFRHGYGHEPLYHYWSVPFQVLLGNNVLSIRLSALFLGMLLVALTLRWARRDFGALAALVAGFGLAISWWPIVFSRIGIRPIMEPVVLVVAALFWPMGQSVVSRRGLILAAVSGAFLGLALYTYTAARVIFALPAAFALYGLVLGWLAPPRTRSSRAASVPAGESSADQLYRSQMTFALVALAIMALVSLPLVATLRADPSLQQRVEQLSGPLDALQEGDWAPILKTTIATLGFFGISGDPRWTYMLPDQPLFGPLGAMLFLFGLMVALAHWRRPAVAFALIWLAVAMVPSAITPDAPSSVRLVGALPVFYLMPALATRELISLARRRRNPGFATAFVGLGLGFVALLAVIRTLQTGFGEWPRSLETRLKYQSVLLDISRDARLDIPGSPPVIADGFYEPIDESSLQRNLNRDPSARWVQSGEANGGAIVWPHSLEGEAGNSSYFYVPEYAAANIDLLAKAGISARPLFRSSGRPSYAVYSLPPPNDELSPLVEFSGATGPIMALLELSGPEDVRDEALLYSSWQVLNKLPEDLAIFVHVVDASGQVVAQFDGLDAAAATLQQGDRVLQRHVIPIPADLPVGRFTLQAGLYQRPNGNRLFAADSGDTVVIGECGVIDVGERQRFDCDLLEPH